MSPLITLADRLDDVRDIVNCLWMAAAAVENREQTDALQTTATAALDKIDEAVKALDEARRKVE